MNWTGTTTSALTVRRRSPGGSPTALCPVGDKSPGHGDVSRLFLQRVELRLLVLIFWN